MEFVLTGQNKEENYVELHRSLDALWDLSIPLEINLLNVFSLYKESFHFLWIGCYMVVEDTLVLGPFQGPVACTKIAFGKGVCGKSWELKQPIIVPNVHEFEGHIACSSQSNSEVVVPVLKNERVVMVLDVDSQQFDYFDQTDVVHLQKLGLWIGQKMELGA